MDVSSNGPAEGLKSRSRVETPAREENAMEYVASGQEDRVEIRKLMSTIDDQEDPRQSFALVQEKIASLRRRGQKVPDELRRIERVLVTELCAESQGR